MYNIDDNVLPSRPVTISSIFAAKEADTWLRENNLNNIEDFDGLLWELNISLKNDDPTSTLQVLIDMVARLDVETLIKVKILSEPEDQRIIDLLEGQSVDIHRKSVSIEASNINEAKLKLAQKINDLRAELQSSSTNEIKRNLVNQWLNKKMCFGEFLNLRI